MPTSKPTAEPTLEPTAEPRIQLGLHYYGAWGKLAKLVFTAVSTVQLAPKPTAEPTVDSTPESICIEYLLTVPCAKVIEIGIEDIGYTLQSANVSDASV